MFVEDVQSLYTWIAALAFLCGIGLGSWLGFLVGVNYVETEKDD